MKLWPRVWYLVFLTHGVVVIIITDLESVVSGGLAAAEVGDDECEQVGGHDGRGGEVVLDPRVIVVGRRSFIVTDQHRRAADHRHVGQRRQTCSRHTQMFHVPYSR